MKISEITSLKKNLREKNQEVKVLQRITQTISSQLDLQEVLHQIIETVVKVTKADACLLYLLDDRHEKLILRASQKPHPKLIGRVRIDVGEGITGWVAKKAKTVAISRNANDDSRFKFFHNLPEDQYQAFLSVPVISQNQVIGVINVQHKDTHKHNPGEISLLSTIGQQVGGAIENARIYREMKKKAQRIETLSRVSTTIASNQYMGEILHLLVTMTAEMMGSKTCSIMLLDDKKKELVIKATQSLSVEYKEKPPLKVGESVSGRAVLEKTPIAVLDVTREAGFKYQRLAKKEGLCSLLSVPMMIKDRVLGVINSYTSELHSFTEEEIHILQAVGNQAAIAIENTSLLERSHAMEEELHTRKVVERAKGLIMKNRKISEEAAFRLLQKQSMNTRRSLSEIAEAVILALGMDR